MSSLDLESEYNDFDWNSYVSHYQDLKNDNIDTKQKAWSHWKNHGENEKRLYFVLNEKIGKTIESVDANFDWVKYTTYYQDLKDDQIDTKEKAWTHWVKYGKKEGRIYFNMIGNAGNINNVAIGNGTPLSGRFTTVQMTSQPAGSNSAVTFAYAAALAAAYGMIMS